MVIIHSLRTKILIIVLAFMTLMSTAFFIYSLATTENYKLLRLESIENMVDFETEKINKIIAELDNSAINLAISGLLYYESKSYGIGETSVLEYLRRYPILAGGGFLFEPHAFNADAMRSRIYAYINSEKGEVTLDEFDDDDDDFYNMDWYREIIESVSQPNQVVWIKPHINDETSGIKTTAGAGIFDKDGGLLGVSVLDWDIEDVVQELVAIKPTLNSFVLLCVPSKNYVISSTRTSSVTGAPITDLPYSINDDSFTLNGIDYLRFGRYMDNGWLLSIQIPRNEIFTDVEKRNNRFSLMIAFSSIFMLLTAYFLITKYINKPIQQLTSNVSQLAIGNFDVRVDVSTHDELGQLAQVFNKMTNELKTSIEENIREHAEKERIGAELNVARAIQANMLPCIFPPFPGRTEFDLYASMLPAKEVGGDFYDFFFIDDDTLALVIADVSGKGVPAALFMVIARTLINNHGFCRSPKTVFRSANKKLCMGNDTSMFVTAFMGFYHIPTGKFTYSNAGHNPPLIKRKNGNYEFLRNEPCMILGWMEDAKYREDEITLEQGDMIFLYTDGITEAMNKEHQLFGEQRLFDTLNKHKNFTSREIIYTVKHEVDVFSDDAEQNDDITMLALRVCSKEEMQAAVIDNVKELKVEARIENLGRVLFFIKYELEKIKYPYNLMNEVCIAVEEIFMNIANYAFKPVSGNAAIFVSTKDRITIRFEDIGKPYNPLEQADPDLNKDLTKRELGGLGVYLVKKLMDNVEYMRVDNKNILIMSRELNR